MSHLKATPLWLCIQQRRPAKEATSSLLTVPPLLQMSCMACSITCGRSNPGLTMREFKANLKSRSLGATIAQAHMRAHDLRAAGNDDDDVV